MSSNHSENKFILDNKILYRETFYLAPQMESLNHLFDLLTTYLEQQNLGNHNINNLKLICEEIFVNIVSYSKTEVEIVFELGHNQSYLFLQFIDTGLPFDPLTQGVEPILGSDPTEIQIGGLGIMMIKKLSDEIGYLRRNDSNIICAAVKH